MAVAVTRDMVRIFSAGVLSIFESSLKLRPGVYQQIASVVPSTLATEEYAWLSQVPVMREFIDERKVSGLGEYGFALKNKKWEATIGFEREVLEDDQTGSVRMRIEQLAEQANAHYDKMVFDLIGNGSLGLSYDGVPFYGPHQVNGATVNNAGTGVLSAANLQSAISRMMRVPMDNGDPAMVEPTHLLVSPENYWAANILINSAYTPNQGSGAGSPGLNASNPLFKSLSVVSSPRLASATEWHLLDCSHSVKPFFVQQRILPELKALDGSDGVTENDFMRDVYLYGVRARHNAGYGLWHFAFKSDGSASS